MRFTELITTNKLFDSHCHLTSPELGVASAINAGDVFHTISIATDLDNALVAKEQSQQSPQKISASIGIDPEVFIPGSSMYIKGLTNEWVEQQRTKLLAELETFEYTMIGECGVDNYHIKNLSQLERDEILQQQEALFRMQCEVAAKYKLPLSIHSRAAEAKCLDIVKAYDVTAVFHSFTGSLNVAEQIIEQGHFLGVNGIVTYKSAGELRNLYKSILGRIENPSPLEFYKRRVVFETDAPWLRPFNGSLLNEPKYIKETYDFMCLQVG